MASRAKPTSLYIRAINIIGSRPERAVQKSPRRILSEPLSEPTEMEPSGSERVPSALPRRKWRSLIAYSIMIVSLIFDHSPVPFLALSSAERPGRSQPER
ncbi:uncharacterized protein BDV17DRAFT_64518 [Aspergillus undulatus]|uniref:uncharacterized protein n=1 Tax=Aspergillus undulatus TaxID=1810928 RepID=UPI003CCCA5BC